MTTPTDDGLWDDDMWIDDCGEPAEIDIAMLHDPYTLRPVLPGYGRPATRPPRLLDVYREVDDVPAIDAYHPSP
ncbi:hypothetical protein ACLQ2N_08345 [Streptomyces sp. DT224]|uniref:hypothetical protein n=1 Tax=Streptomyces sp. DT224 TaxID=3393426 RepID=UPI003CFB1221